MAWLHRHYWREYQRIFAHPWDGGSVSGVGAGNAMKLAFGVTTILQRCDLCGVFIKIEVLGDARGKTQEPPQ